MLFESRPGTRLSTLLAAWRSVWTSSTCRGQMPAIQRRQRHWTPGPTVAETLEIRCLPTVTFSVTFNDPGSTYSAYYAGLEAVTIAAGDEWASYIDGNSSIEVQIQFANVPTANATSVETVYRRTVEGIDIYMAGAAAEILTGNDPNGTAPDLVITVGTTYLTTELWLDPTPYIHTDPVPENLTDAYSVMIHELGHGLGFNGWHSYTDGSLPGDYASTYDQWVIFTGGNLYFTGPQAQAVYGGPVPLTYGNSAHVGNDLPRPGSELIPDVMNGVVFQRGLRMHLSALDLAILADTEVPLLPDTGENFAPVIEPQTFAVAEQSENGFVFATVLASDLNAGQSLTYAIQSGNEAGAFRIDAATGELRVFDGSLLDLDNQATYELIVQVTDNGFPSLSSTALITINLEEAVLPSVVTTPGSTTGAKTLIDAAATFDTGNIGDRFYESRLEVTITSGAQAVDKLLFNKQSGIKAKKGGLFIGKTRIADVTGVKTGGPLSIVFTENHVTSHIQQVVRGIQFQSKKKATGTREITFQFFLVGGQTSGPATKALIV